MNKRFILAAHHLNGQRTAENYVDDCVMRRCDEPNVLSNIVVNLIAGCGTAEAASETMNGFCDYLHGLLRAKYGPPPAHKGDSE